MSYHWVHTMNTTFTATEPSSAGGSPWIVRQRCSRSLQKIQGGCREEGSSGGFADGELAP